MPALTMRCAARSLTGRRANNEDAVYASPRLVAVADGVGGAAATIDAPVRRRARAGDRLLLCSDGVSDSLDDVEISDALSLPDADAAAAALVDGALAAGGRDNVSAVVADVVARVDDRAGWLPAL